MINLVEEFPLSIGNLKEFRSKSFPCVNELGINFNWLIALTELTELTE